VPALDLDDDALALAGVVIEEVDIPVYALICAFLAVINRPALDQSQRPVLELVAVLFGEGLSAPDVLGVGASDYSQIVGH